MGNATDRNLEPFVPILTLTGRIGFLTPLCFGHSCKAPRERRRALVAGVSESAGTWSEGSCGLRGSRRPRDVLSANGSLLPTTHPRRVDCRNVGRASLE